MIFSYCLTFPSLQYLGILVRSDNTPSQPASLTGVAASHNALNAEENVARLCTKVRTDWFVPGGASSLGILVTKCTSHQSVYRNMLNAVC